MLELSTPTGQLESLVELGLPQSQARIYLALLSGGPAAASVVARRAGVARQKVYEALEALERGGFCLVGGERVATFEAVPPEVALAEWANRRAAERRRQEEHERRLRQELVRALPRSAPPAAPSQSLMEGLSGVPRTAEAYEQLLGAALERLDIVQALPQVQPRERWNLLEGEAAARGVHVRVLLTPEAAANAARLAGLGETGCEWRISDRLALKLALRDGVEALVALRDPEGHERDFTAVRILHPALVSPLALLFQREWRRAAKNA